MNSIWNSNIQAFKNRFPALAELYKTFTAEPPVINFWKLSQAKNGSPTAEDTSVTPSIRLHSSYNPEREAFNAITQPQIINNQAIVFYGFGLGYHITQLASYLETQNQNTNQNTKKPKIIIIEPQPEYFFASLSQINWAQVFKIEQLILAVGAPAEAILPLIEDTSKINIGAEGVSTAYYFDIPAFTAHNKPYFETVKTIIERNKSKNEINAATYEKFSKLWIHNSKTNLPNIVEKRTLNEYLHSTDFTNLLNHKTKTKTAIVIAAGPSLEQILPKLNELKSQSVLICVETALQAMLRYKVEPDFLLLTDPQYWAYKHIASLSAPQSILISPISVYPAVFRFNCKEILLCSDMFPISQFFEKNTESFGDLGAGGSVASSAWNLAYLFGANNIYLAGLDLSFPTKQTHIKGSSAEQTFHAISTKTQSAEKSSCQTIFSANPDYGKTYSGKTVLTDSRMKMFAWWFESRIASCPEVKTYSLCPESLQIPGVEYCSLDSLLESKGAPAPSSKQLDLPKVQFQPFSTTPSSGEKKTETLINLPERQPAFERPRNAPDTYKHLLAQYKKELDSLISLINRAVETCIIGGENQDIKLQQLENQINLNSLFEIVRLAIPSEKKLTGLSIQNKKLEVYKQLQKEVIKYQI